MIIEYINGYYVEKKILLSAAFDFDHCWTAAVHYMVLSEVIHSNYDHLNV
jgi:hypothetical protein